MAIGADEIVTLAGDDIGLAVDVDHIVAGAGIDRDLLALSLMMSFTLPLMILKKSKPPDEPASWPRRLPDL